jgi:hypothetical protein
VSLPTTPTAARLTRPRWRDPRLVLGLLLVLVSMVAGARVVAGADATVPVWSVTTDLGAATPLTSSDLVARRVRVEGGLDHYVAADGPAPVGRVLLRPVSSGELLPAAALAPQDVADLRRVAVRVSTAAGLTRGSVVDLYALPAGTAAQKVAAPPRVVVRNVTVAEVADNGRSLGGSAPRDVILLVHDPDVRSILAARSEGEIQLVQLAGRGDVPPPEPATGEVRR